MIAIRVLLVGSLGLTLVWFLRSRNATPVRAAKKVLLVLLVLFAVVVILDPSIADRVAQALGVGRGADLLLYSVSVAFFFATLNNYLKSREADNRLSRLAREVALLEERVRRLSRES